MCRVFEALEDSVWCVYTMVNNYTRQNVIDHQSGRVYRLWGTFTNVLGLYGEMDDPENPFPYDPIHRREVLDLLNDLRFLVGYDMDWDIWDLYDGNIITLREFFRRYGAEIVYETDESDDSLASIDDVVEFPAWGLRINDDDSTITSQEEEDIVMLAQIPEQED